MRFFNIALLLLLVVFPTLVSAQTNVIYVIDTSGSMKTNDLYGQLMDGLENRFLPNLDDDDYVVLMTFHETTTKNYEFKASDKAAMKRAVRELSSQVPNHNYTNLTGAVHAASMEADRLQAKNPGWETEVYLFTDGKQDIRDSTPEPRSWDATMRSEFAGGTIKKPDVHIYLVKLPGADVPNLPDEITSIEMPDPRRGILKFEEIYFEGKKIKIQLDEDGAIPPEESWQVVEIKIKAAQVLPKGDPKDVVFSGLDESRVNPKQARFSKKGEKEKLKIDFPLVKGIEELKIRVSVQPANDGFDCDKLLTITVPVEFKAYTPPLWKKIWNWLSGLPLWLLGILLLILLLLLICLFLPKFSKNAKINSGDVDYRLKRRASLCGTTVALGPARGIPFGTGAQKIGILKASYGGTVYLHPKVQGVDVNGIEVGKKKTKLAGYATITFEGSSVDFSS